MWIGYLQLGPPEHGICRYGKLLAAEGHKRPDCTIAEVNISLTKNRQTNRQLLISAARQLSKTEIIHIQYSGKNNRPLWGNQWEQLYYFWVFKYHCLRPIVVTLHDIYEPPLRVKTVLNQADQKFESVTLQTSTKQELLEIFDKPLVPELSLLAQAVKLIKRMYGINAVTFRWLLEQAKLVFVCSWEEAKRLQSFVDTRKTKVIPHFVEKRNLTYSQAKVKEKLKLDGNKIVTVLGFIHGRKGYQLMVETMPKLPQNVKVVFAGGSSPGNEDFVGELIQLAKAKGVDDRLRITGYLSEEELDEYLFATDLAVCPFKFFSASGSLSTWISAVRPILAYDLPQISEYNSIEPGAIKTFHPYDSDVLAQAINQFLMAIPQNEESAIARLREKLSISIIFDRQLHYYRQITKTLTPSSLKSKDLKS